MRVERGGPFFNDMEKYSYVLEFIETLKSVNRITLNIKGRNNIVTWHRSELFRF